MLLLSPVMKAIESTPEIVFFHQEESGREEIPHNANATLQPWLTTECILPRLPFSGWGPAGAKGQKGCRTEYTKERMNHLTSKNEKHQLLSITTSNIETVNSSKNPQQFIIILTLRSTFVNSLTFTCIQDSTHRQRHQHSALHLWTFRYLSPSLAQTFNLSSRTWNNTTRIRAVTGLPRLSTCSSSRRCHSHQSASPPCQHLLSWLFPPIANTVKEELAPHYRNILLQCINNIINHNNQVQQRLSLAWWAGNDDSKSSSMNLDFHPSFLLGSYVHYSVWYTMQETVLETRSGTKLLCLSAWGLWWVRNRHWGLFLLQPEQNTRCYRWAFAELRTKFYSSGIRFNQQTYWVVWHDPQNQFWELGCCIHLTTTDYIPNPTQATHTYYSLKWR